MVDFELVKRVAKTLDMSEQEVMNTQFIELIELLVNENSRLIENSFINASINDYCREAHRIARSKGWYEDHAELGTSIALIHSEVSEALEALRKDDMENFQEELADVCIRVFDLSGYLEIDLGQAIDKKMEKNRGRSYKHGGKKF